MKSTSLIALLFVAQGIYAQELKEEKLIAQFVVDLFDNGVSAETVVDHYIEIKPDDRNTLSMTDRKRTAIGIIKKTRNGEEEQGMWLIPNNTIKHPKIVPYKDVERLSKIDLNDIKTIRNRVYVLLDQNEETILQHFLLNETKDKLLSFSLIIKDGNRSWFFAY